MSGMNVFAHFLRFGVFRRFWFFWARPVHRAALFDRLAQSIPYREYGRLERGSGVAGGR